MNRIIKSIVIITIVMLSAFLTWFVYMNGCSQGQYYFIDDRGNVVSNITFKDIEGCIVLDGGDECYIFLSHNRFDANSIFYKDILFIVDSEGKIILKGTTGDNGDYYVNGVWDILKYKGQSLFIDKNGKVIYKVPNDKIIKNGTNYCGIVPFCYSKSSNDTSSSLYGYINMNGEIVVEPQYYRAGVFSKEGYAWVETEDMKYGFIDIEGKIVVPAIYDEASDFSDGLAQVGLDGKYYYIDVKGNRVLEREGQDFSEGYAVVRNEDGKYAYMDKEGKLITDYIYDNAFSFSNGYALVKIDGLYGYVDVNGNIVINPQFEKAYDFASNGLAAAQGDNGLMGFINTYGEWVIEPQYNGAGDFINGVAMVKKD